MLHLFWFLITIVTSEYLHVVFKHVMHLEFPKELHDCQNYSVVYAVQIVFWEVHNRDTIWQACHDFGRQWACFAGCSIVTQFWENMTRFSACWARFQDKVGRTHQTCHDLAKRGTILTAKDCYISVSVHIMKGSLKREKLGKSKEVTLGLRVFD